MIFTRAKTTRTTSPCPSCGSSGGDRWWGADPERVCLACWHMLVGADAWRWRVRVANFLSRTDSL